MCRTTKERPQFNDEFSEGEFFGFAKSYLSEAFPNPQRVGCPQDSDLQRMAEHPVEGRDAVQGLAEGRPWGHQPLYESENRDQPGKRRGSAESRLRPQNKKLLRWLDSWLATPDDRGEAWWSEFEADLEDQRRMGFGPNQAG